MDLGGTVDGQSAEVNLQVLDEVFALLDFDME